MAKQMCSGFDIEKCPNESDYIFRDGGTTYYYCGPCAEEYVLSIIRGNEFVTFEGTESNRDGYIGWDVE